MSKTFNIPGIGRVSIATERFGAANRGMFIHSGGDFFETNLSARVIRGGQAVKAKDVMHLNPIDSARFGDSEDIDLGSGLVTNVGVLSLANSFGWSIGGISTLKLANYHASGTGATAAAATDISLQTADSVTPVAGAQSLISAANSQKYQTVATLSYSGNEAVTEWGLFLNGTLSSSNGSPVTAGSSTTATVTGTPYTASDSTHQGEQQFILHDTGNATPMWGLITSNTTSQVTVPAWYKVSDGTAAGTNPANTDTMVIRPVMWDHKVFSAVNVQSGDSIQFTYTLLISSGG